MFTGIIETLASVTAIRQQQSNVIFEFASAISPELKIDQSVAHNGVCLTVTAVQGSSHTVTAIAETLQRTNLGKLCVGDKVNLERCLRADGRFDGHFVQGHIDQTAICTDIAEQNGSWRYVFDYDARTGNFTVEKGSICVNGVSLTVVDSEQGRFSVAIIPYTYEHTNFHHLRMGDTVNLEFDVLGKYIKKIMALYLPASVQ